MADFKLSSSRLSTTGTSSQIRPSIIPTTKSASSLQAPSIRPASTKFTPAPIPKAVQDQTSAGIQKFMGSLTEAAFKYQERESSYQATEMIMAYQEAADAALLGRVQSDGSLQKGYSQTKGAEALGGYSILQGKSEELYKDMLAAAPPAVRQKAYIQMTNIKGNLLNAAAGHRVKQLGEAEQEQKFLRLKQLTFQVAASPGSIDTVIPGTGSATLRSKFYAEHSSQQEADKAWYSLMEDSAQTMFLETESRLLAAGDSAATEKAYQTVQGFYNSIAATEVSSDPEVSGRMLGDLRRWRGYADAAYNSREAKAESLFNKRESEMHDITATKLVSGAIQGNVIPQNELVDLQTAGRISGTFARSYLNKYYNKEGEGGKDKEYDPSLVDNLNSRIERGEDVREQIHLSNLPTAVQTELNNKYKNLRNPSYNSKLTRLRRNITTYVNSSLGVDLYFTDTKDPKVQMRVIEYENEAVEMIKEGIQESKINSILKEVILGGEQIPEADHAVSPDAIDTPLEGITIRTLEELEEQAVILEDMETLLGITDPRVKAFKEAWLKAGNKLMLPRAK